MLIKLMLPLIGGILLVTQDRMQNVITLTPSGKKTNIVIIKNIFASEIFYSKLSYCLPVFGNVLGLEEYKENNSRYTSYTTTDNNRIQVLQNKLNRLLTGAHYRTPTVELLERTDS